MGGLAARDLRLCHLRRGRNAVQNVVYRRTSGRLWARPHRAISDNPTCYATSQDGLHWEKPLVGLRSNQGEKTNALLYATHLASVTKISPNLTPGLAIR